MGTSSYSYETRQIKTKPKITKAGISRTPLQNRSGSAPPEDILCGCNRMETHYSQHHTNLTRPKQYFSNGFSDTSDEETDPVEERTHTNNVKPVYITKCVDQNMHVPASRKYENQVDTCDTYNGRTERTVSKSVSVVINTSTRFDSPQRNAKSKDHTVEYNNGVDYSEESSDEDDFPFKNLTHVNSIRPDTSRKGKESKQISSTFENDNIKRGFAEVYTQTRDPNNRLRGNDSTSTVSTLSSGSYFDNGFEDESDEESVTFLTFRNDFSRPNNIPMNSEKEDDDCNRFLTFKNIDVNSSFQQPSNKEGSSTTENGLTFDIIQPSDPRNRNNSTTDMYDPNRQSDIPSLQQFYTVNKETKLELPSEGGKPQANDEMAINNTNSETTINEANNEIITIKTKNEMKNRNERGEITIIKAPDMTKLDDMTARTTISKPVAQRNDEFNDYPIQDKKTSDDSFSNIGKSLVNSLDITDPDTDPKTENGDVLNKLQIPFKNTFCPTGVRSEGKTIFEMQLQANNFSTTNVSKQLGEKSEPFGGDDDDDDDIEIDGEKSQTFKQKLTESCETKSSSPFPENQKKERTVIGVSRLGNRSFQHSAKSRIDRQSSLGAYGHTCSGCGRKDCDGNFMKLLRAMIQAGRKKGFEIRNVVPDGNCMFAAVIDQLELLQDCSTSPMALRQACVQFLKSNPTSEDGTPYCLFVDGESWEDYLSRMGQEGQWGDHLMLQAISNVIQRTVTIINGEDERKWTNIHPMSEDSTKSEPVFLGHVGELHYVSMRPIIKNEILDDNPLSYTSLDLYSLMPSLPNLEDTEQQQLFKEDYIDPWSDIPAVHLTYLIKQFIPLKATIKNADSMCHQAFAIESSTDEFIGQKSGVESVIQFKAIGDVVEGLYASSLDDHHKTENLISGEWTDVGIICSLTTCIAYPQNMENEGTSDISDVTINTEYTHPGFARLLARYPDRWGQDQSTGSTMRYFIPNTHRRFEDSDVTKRFKEQYASQNPAIVYLFRKRFSAIYSPFWPEEATAWRTRSRAAGWPMPNLIDSIVSEGVHYISLPHSKSSNPGIEFQICFGVAERRLANEGLLKEQRYCFIVFKAMVSHALLGDEIINSSHLKSIFFHGCEQVPQQYWTSRISACILYLLDNLIKQLELQNLPNYFISTNNMIDHLSSDQIVSVLEKLKTLRTNPIISLYSIAYQNMITNADEIFQAIQHDIDAFHYHLSVRRSVIETLVPAKIRQASKYIELNNFDMAIEIIQEAHEDRLLVSTCEDNIPFVAFVTEVTNSFGLTKQWWLCVHADETLGTALATDLSLHHDPIPLKEIVGNYIADRYGELLIPRPLAEQFCSLCYDFYIYLTLKHRKKSALAFIVKAREIFLQMQQFGSFPQDFPCAINPDDFSLYNIFKIYRSFVQSFVMTVSSEALCSLRLDEIAREIEAVCEKVHSEESYTVLILMWKYLGNTEKFNDASAKLEYVSAAAKS